MYDAESLSLSLSLCLFLGIVLRWTHILRLKEMWKEFETTVKDFLEWLMAEAKSFSKDVTTLGGEKGVFDHMNTCEVSSKEERQTFACTYM